MMPRDTLFQDPHYRPDQPFQFDEAVANVFEDMISRSVPFYSHIQTLIADLAPHFYKPNTSIIDLGCSTGLTIRTLAANPSLSTAHFLGIDNSPSMLQQATKLCRGLIPVVTFQNTDLNEPIQLPVSSVIILNLVLQFIRPQNRVSLVQSLFETLLPGGAIFVIEKIKPKHSALEPLWQDLYHQFKRKQGYTPDEISRKQAALQTVLIPYTSEDTMALFQKASMIEPVFQWHHFFGFLAIK